MHEDLRSAARAVLRAKGLTVALVLSLALGTGANAAVCGIAYRLLIGAPDGVRAAAELASVYTSEFSGAPYGLTSYPDYLAVAERLTTGTLAAFDDGTTANARRVPRDGEQPTSSASRLVRGAKVTATFFPTLGLRASAGRLLDEAAAISSPQGAVISGELADALGGASTVVGRHIAFGPTEYLVVGVAAAKFRGLHANRPVDVWVPFDGARAADRGDRRLSVIVRQRGSLESLDAALDALSRELASRHPQTNLGSIVDPGAPRRLRAVGYSRVDPGARAATSIVVMVVLGAVGLLLAGACVNAGTLLLSRAMARRREVAVKMALGASRGALARQLLLESVIISVTGGVLGLLFAAWIVGAVPAMFSPDHAALLDNRVDSLLVALTLGVATVTGAVFGIAPAIQGTGAPAVLALRGDAGGVSESSGGTRVRSLLITIQLAVSTLLLIVTSVLGVTLSRSLQGDLAGGARSVAMLAVENPGGNCHTFDAVRGARFQHAVAAEVPRMTGVSAVGWASTPPLGRHTTLSFGVRAGARAVDRVELDVNVVTPGYFAVIGLPLVEGRLLNAGDGARTEVVAVVDELLARRLFGLSAVGQHLLTHDGRPVRIVGVVGSGRFRTLQAAPQPTVYLPYSQAHLPCGFLFVKTATDPAAMAPWIAGRLLRLDGGVTVTRRTTLEQHLSEALLIDRLTTTLVGLCGAIALLMAMAGVYGVMNDAVLRRTREIGLRLALGAGPPQVMKLVFLEALYITAGGLLLGAAAALVLERVATTFVHAAPEVDLLLFAAAPASLAVVVILAAVPPLRRALAVSPTTALHAQ